MKQSLFRGWRPRLRALAPIEAHESGGRRGAPPGMTMTCASGVHHSNRRLRNPPSLHHSQVMSEPRWRLFLTCSPKADPCVMRV